jgi:hypothetical protein
MNRLLRLVCLVSTSDTWARHAELLAATPAAQQAIVDLLLRCCLPFLLVLLADAAACGVQPTPAARGQMYRLLACLEFLLQQPTLAAGLESVVRQPGAAALMQQAARLARALPLCPPAGISLRDHLSTHIGGFKLLGALSCQLQPACCSCGASEDACSGDRGGTNGGCHHPAGTPVPISRAEQAAAWELLRLVPHLACVLEAIAERGSPADLAVACDDVASALSPLPGMVGMSSSAFIDSWQQLEDCGAACDAGLRLVTRLVQWEDSWQHLPQAAESLLSGESSQTAPRLAMVLLELLRGACHDTSKQGGPVAWEVPRSPGGAPGGEQAAPTSLARWMWRLHSSTCRLVHWLAAWTACGAACMLAPADGSPGLLNSLVGSLSVQLLTVQQQLLIEPEKASQGRWAAVCAARQLAVSAC